MSAVAIIRGTGFAGAQIAAEAVERGYKVISLNRNAPSDPPTGIEFRTGSIEDEALVNQLFADADVVVIAINGAVGNESNSQTYG